MILCRKPKRLHPKIARTHTGMQQCARIQNQCTEIRCIFINNNEKEEKETNVLITFIIAPKSISYLGRNLTKEVKDLYSANYRKLMKEIEENTKKWKNIPCYGLEEQILLKCPYYPKHATHLMQSLSKFHWYF